MRYVIMKRGKHSWKKRRRFLSDWKRKFYHIKDIAADEKELTAQMASIFIDKVFLLDGKKVEVILNFKDEYKNLYSHMGQVWGAEERKSN